MKIYLVRHAQRGWGKDYDSLNDIGKIQARCLGSYFKSKKIDFVYCSENERAKQTLRFIETFLKKGTNIIITEEVRQHNVPEEVVRD